MPRLPAFVFLLALGACSADVGDGLQGGGCTTNEDCAASEWCSAQVCTPGTGNACEVDGDCAASETCDVVTDCGATRCSGNTCVPRTCEDDDDCEGELVCEESQCREPNRGDCETDDDCEVEGDVCVMGTCSAPVECEDVDDCEDGQQCFEGVCRDPCDTDDDCAPPFFRCDQASNECRPGCFNDGQCPDPLICESLLCVDPECTSDEECGGANVVCDGGRCAEFEPCGANGECPVGFACDETTNRCEALPACRTDRDCEGDAYCDAGFCVPADGCENMSCGAGFECIADICVPASCRGDADCTAPELCIGGTCEAPPNGDFVTEVRIVSPAGYVRPGTTYRFVALALDQAGRAVPGVSFQWTSTATAVATIDASGLATGRAVAGTTDVTARVATAIGPVVSNPVRLTNLGAATAGAVRVTVQSLVTGLPIAGAAVELTSAGPLLAATTAADGVATFANAPANYTVTAAHADYDWVTVISPTSDDLLLALPPRSSVDLAAGVKGDVDLARVASQGAVSLSLSGASMPSPLFGFDPGMLFGNGNFEVTIPMVGSVPIPAANTLAIEIMNFPLSLKDTYYAEAQPGLRALWSFGGRVQLGTNGLGPGAFGNFLAAILPFYQRFDHAVLPSVNLVSRPLVVDTNDIDGDGDTTEQLPDWSAFPTRRLEPHVAQSLRYDLAVANLPFVSGGNANTLIVLSGTIVPGLGFVPLGLDGQSDMGGTGIVDAFVTKMAPRHGGLEVGTYAVMTIAVRLDAGGLPGPGSVRLFTSSRLPTRVDLTDGWLDSPVSGEWNPASRTVVVGGGRLGADLFRASFVSAAGGWHVYADTNLDGTLVLPDAPAGLADRTLGSEVTLDLVDLTAGADTGTLFDAAAGGAPSFDAATRGFSRAAIASP